MTRSLLLPAQLGSKARRAWKDSSLSRDAGYSTETVVVTALLAMLALTAIGIVVAKVVGRANGIDLGG